MRYKPGIMVSVISIFEAFEFVAFETAFDYVMHTWKLCSLIPISPWWLTLCPSKWSPLGMVFLLGGPLRVIMPFLTILVTFHTSSPHLLTFGIFGCTDPRRDCPSFHGKKGLKAQRGDSWKNTKS
jgi:hypothetical protein